MDIEWCKCEVLVLFAVHWESVGHTFGEVVQLVFLVLDEAHSCDVFGLGGVGAVIWVVMVSCMIWYYALVLVSGFVLDSWIQISVLIVRLLINLIHIHLKPKCRALPVLSLLLLLPTRVSIILLRCSRRCHFFAWALLFRAGHIEMPRPPWWLLVPRREGLIGVDARPKPIAGSKGSASSHAIWRIAFALNSIDYMHSFIEQFIESAFIIQVVLFINCLLELNNEHIACKVYVGLWIRLGGVIGSLDLVNFWNGPRCHTLFFLASCPFTILGFLSR